MTYDFSTKKISVKGETFIMELDWKKLYEVKELGGWLLLYQNSKMANIIPVESFGNQFEEFKNLVKSVPGLKYKFR